MRPLSGDDVIARGRRTVVRRKRLRDVKDEYKWRRDADLARFDASRPVQVPFDGYQRNWSFDFRFTDMSSRSFAIEDESGSHIGNIMYYNIDPDRRAAEIGISIGNRHYWSNGYGSDALQTVAKALTDSGGLRRLYLHTLEWNVRAQRAFEKAGFVATGTSWRDGNTFIVMEYRREQVLPQAPVRHAIA